MTVHGYLHACSVCAWVEKNRDAEGHVDPYGMVCGLFTMLEKAKVPITAAKARLSDKQCGMNARHYEKPNLAT